MSKRNLKEYLKELLAKGEVKKVINILLAWSKENNSDLYDKVILISNRYKSYQEKRVLMLGKQEELEHEINRILYTLLIFVNEIPEDDTNLIQDVVVDESEEIEKSKEEEEQDTSFGYWLSNKTRIGTIFVFVGSLGLLIAGLTITVSLFESWASNFENYEQLTLIGIILHIVVAGIGIRVINNSKLFDKIEKKYNQFAKNDTQNNLSIYLERAKIAIKEFKWCWKWVWIGWLVLYSSFLIKYYHKYFTVFNIDNYLGSFVTNNEMLIQIWLDAWSYVSSLGLIACFSILFYKNKNRKNRHYDNPISIYSMYIIITIILIEIIVSLYTGVNTDKELIENLNIQTLFKIIVGMFSSLSIALLTGRLDSKFISAPIIFIIIFYLYSGIQPLVAFFEPEFLADNVEEFSDITMSFTLNYALFSKCLLFLFILWLINEGKLMLYIVRLNSVIDDIPKQV